VQEENSPLPRWERSREARERGGFTADRQFIIKSFIAGYVFSRAKRRACSGDYATVGSFECGDASHGSAHHVKTGTEIGTF